MELNSEKILIVLLGSIGDVVRGLPLLAEIKKAWPEAKIDWLVEPKSVAPLRLNRHLDQIWVFDRQNWFSSVKKLLPKLRQQNYTICLDLQRHFKSGLFSLLSGARRRIGFHHSDSKEFNWLFTTEQIEERGEQLPKLKHYLTFLDRLGIKLDAQRLEKLDFGLDLSRITLRSELEIEPQTYGLVLGSSWQTKDWPVSGYLELAENLLDRDKSRLVLLGDASQRQNAAWLVQELKCRSKDLNRVSNFVAMTTLEELTLLISRCKLLIGPDSGPGHLAGALGVPYIGLFGPTSATRNGVNGSEHLTLDAAVPCSPCLRRKCPGLNKICMRLISPGMVLEKLDYIL